MEKKTQFKYFTISDWEKEEDIFSSFAYRYWRVKQQHK